MSSDQKKVLIGMGRAIVFSAAFFVCMFRLLNIDITPPRGLDLAWKLSHAIKWDAIAALCLLAGIGWVANQRFTSPGAIDGSPAPFLDIDRRYVQNTLEQLMLAVIAHLGLAVELPDNALQAIPILVALFVIGRVAFWIGYHIAPSARAFGFATTFYPTVAAYVYVIAKIFAG